jgi:two-component system response regulator NreC
MMTLKKTIGRSVASSTGAAEAGGTRLSHLNASPPPDSPANAANNGADARSSVVKNRIVLVESHGILRDGLRALLEMEPDFQVVGSVGDAVAALSAVQTLQPHVVLTGIALPGRSGIDLIRDIVALTPTVRMVVLTAHGAEEYIRAALNAGAHGYVLKDSGRTELLQAIRAVVAGRQYLCAAVAAKVVSGFVSGREQKPVARPEDLVTGRERQVLTLIALGHSNKVIARDLGLSVKTIEKHRANLMRKLTLHNAAAVTLFALRRGFIDASSLEAAPSDNSAGGISDTSHAHA